MRCATIAVATAVALLTNAIAHAGSPAPTTAVAGYCEWSTEPNLFELTELVGDADCASDAAVVVDPHLVAEVIEREVYVGPREMGKPSGTEREIRFAWFPAPFADPEHPGAVVFAMNQYQSYRDLKAANGRWMNTVSTFGEKAGEVSKHFFLGPKWMQNGGAAGVKTAIDVVGAAAFQAPFVVMAPYTAGISMLPSTAMTAEALFMAPTGTAHGASEFVDGIKFGNWEQALEGAAEFCGNVGIVLLAAAPAAEAGNAALPGARAPISPFHGKVVPTLRVPNRAIVSEGKFGYLFGRASGNKHNIDRAAGNAVELRRVGIHDDQVGRAMLQRHFDETVADSTNIVSTHTNQWGTFQTRESLLAGPDGFLKFRTTWEVVSETEFRMTTAIPFGERQ